MTTRRAEPVSPTTAELSRSRVLALCVVTFLLMLPETLPVPVLRALVLDRFQVTDGLAALFMAANMLGALVAAPLVGLYVDRRGGRRQLALLALVADALLMQALAHPHDFTTFLLLRVFEGAAHIVALLLVTSIVADAAGARRGPALGALGAGLTLGVASGAAIGGAIGRTDPLLTLHTASVVLAVTAALAAFALPVGAPVVARESYGALLAAVRRQPGLHGPLLLAGLERFTVGFFTTGFPLLLAGLHGIDRPSIGMLLGAFLFPFALLSYPAGALASRWTARRMAFWGSLLYGISVVAVPLVPPGLLWALMPWLGLCSAVMFVPSLLWLLERAHGVGRSTAIGSFHAAGSLGFLLGPLCCGALVELGGSGLGGYQVAFAVAGLSVVGGALLARRRPT